MRTLLIGLGFVAGCAVGLHSGDDLTGTTPPAQTQDSGASGVGKEDAHAAVDSGALDAGQDSGVTSASDAGSDALPSDGVWANDRPYYNSPEELCAYVNSQRQSDQGHDRYKGFPWRGAYHQTRTWPIPMTIDPTLSQVAQAEAQRVAAGGSPAGQSSDDSSWRRPVWFGGVETAQEVVTSQDRPGEWDPSTDFASKAALIGTNGSARMGLFYHDSGGDGPALRKMGCGGALASDGQSKWWVVVLAP
jgi:hypothetical protein